MLVMSGSSMEVSPKSVSVKDHRQDFAECQVLEYKEPVK